MKIAIVTGASSGMGRELVMELADRFGGLDEIWAVARRRERLEELVPQTPVPLRIFDIDLSMPSGWKELEEALKERRPSVKFLANCAGFGKIGPVGGLPMEDETGMVRLNCEALCAVTHLTLPYMGQNSRILQFASSAAFLPQPGFAIYAATKAFVLSYSRALGAELKGRGIYVTAVCPGPVKTEFFDIAQTTGEIPLYKRLAMANPKRVVRKAVRDSVMGRPLSVYGLLMKMFRVLCRAVPHRWILAAMFSGGTRPATVREDEGKRR